MKKKEFMNQKVSELTISELAEAIKIKGESGWVIGSKVKRRNDMGTNDGFGEGMIGTIISTSSDYDVTHIYDVIHINVKLSNGKLSVDNHQDCLELVTDQKEEWKDITKGCVFTPELQGDFYHLDIIHEGVDFGFLSGHSKRGDIAYSEQHKYKLEFKGEKDSHFKILKKVKDDTRR